MRLGEGDLVDQDKLIFKVEPACSARVIRERGNPGFKSLKNHFSVNSIIERIYCKTHIKAGQVKVLSRHIIQKIHSTYGLMLLSLFTGYLYFSGETIKTNIYEPLKSNLFVMSREKEMATAFVSGLRELISLDPHELQLLIDLADHGVYDYAITHLIMGGKTQSLDFQEFVLWVFVRAEAEGSSLRKDLLALFKRYLVPIVDEWEYLYGPLTEEDRYMVKLLAS